MSRQIVSDLSCMSAESAVTEAHRCLLCHDAPCTEACPASVDVMHFIRALRFGVPRRAAEIIRRTNVLGGICGSVCPRERLCEGACLRNALQDPIRIGELQTHAATIGFETGRRSTASLPADGPRVAVVGAGPAGLAATSALASAGVRVTIFESREKAGGMLTYGVPQSRMPHAFVKRELQGILDLDGVDFENGRCLGRDFGIEELSTQGFEAVFLGIGLWKSARLPGISDVPGVLHAMPFLESAARHERFGGSPPEVGTRCAVIGGGSVAMDCAEVAMELGCEDVHLICLEGTSEMPATCEDITGAWRKGVHFWTRRRVISTDVTDHDSIDLVTTGIRWRNPGVFEPSNAEDVPHSRAILRVHHVIVAIGQSFDRDLDAALDKLERDRTGRIIVEPSTGESSIPAVYAGGDCAAGCGQTVVASVAEGRRAGLAIAARLGREVQP